MGVDIDGSEAPPEPTINWLHFQNIFLLSGRRCGGVGGGGEGGGGGGPLR